MRPLSQTLRHGLSQIGACIVTGFSADVRAQLMKRSSGVCEVCGNARAEEMHHRRPRGMGGSKRTETNTASAGIHICSACHSMIERHRNIAMLCGWLVSQYEDEPASVPVMYRGDLVRLDDDGGKACA